MRGENKMNEKHYRKNLSAFLNHQLPIDERQRIAEHLLQCADCRKEHDELKFAASLAGNLKRADAPANLWNEIEKTLDEKKSSQTSLMPHISFFNLRGVSAAAAILVVGFGLVAAVHFSLFRNESGETAKTKPPLNQAANIETTRIFSTPNENSMSQNSVAQNLPNVNSNIQISPINKNSINQSQPEINSIETIASPNNSLFWNVETLAGMPKAGNQTISGNGKLVVGQFLETDANSRARVQVANIGQVEIAPNSRVRLVKTQSSEHRLSLERGVLQAKIVAPPRLFIVDTPSAVAIDLGCEYTLEVDKDGSSKLRVTAGFVALERDGRESIVPAGAVCLTKKGKGLGTPFSDDASVNFQNALFKFDFENGGNESVNTIIKESNVYDAITLWHLLSRTRRQEREKVFDALVSLVKLPKGATRGNVLKLNKKMLDDWWKEIEAVWFG